MKVLITGAQGFIGKNLSLHLTERKDVEVVAFTRDQQTTDLPRLLAGVDVVFHLAGINRPQDPQEFISGNADLTHALCRSISENSNAESIQVIYTSSTQAANDNPYGRSKLAAENALFELQRQHGTPVHVFRLPNVFGKWCRPNYNSAVATFCHNIARELPIQINDPAAPLTLVYVDDVIARFMQLMDGAAPAVDARGFATLTPQYLTTVGEVASKIAAFKASRVSLVTDRVGTGLTRALHSTYVSHLPPEAFSYIVPRHADPRGVFVEMLKTPDCGQFSYFTALPGVTRGGHYHHSKTEKFLVIEGQARFRFRHMLTGATHELQTSADVPQVVETVPGWTHDVTNTGEKDMVVMLWANEIFDREHPDTFASPV
ncbi:UDP-2-acetamido-2,6-beta-L-arabino-hexul-4-ose reductase [Hydrogenophaga sp.]|uniref:UDP-2-acetamido-2,6-beta-L-arabino-hexul-4-ose reductase n=1 Tax=Hydrogenophaga sp. TaxID=1904254 RepID=UPI002FCC53EA